MNGLISRVIVVATSIVAASVVTTSASSNVMILTNVELGYQSPTTTEYYRLFTEGDSVETYKILNSQPLIEIADMAHDNYSTWLVRSFTVSFGAMALGLLSLICIVLSGISWITVIGTYLIPISLMAIYYLLGLAEKASSS